MTVVILKEIVVVINVFENKKKYLYYLERRLKQFVQNFLSVEIRKVLLSECFQSMTHQIKGYKMILIFARALLVTKENLISNTM